MASALEICLVVDIIMQTDQHFGQLIRVGEGEYVPAVCENLRQAGCVSDQDGTARCQPFADLEAKTFELAGIDVGLRFRVEGGKIFVADAADHRDLAFDVKGRGHFHKGAAVHLISTSDHDIPIVEACNGEGFEEERNVFAAFQRADIEEIVSR